MQLKKYLKIELLSYILPLIIGVIIFYLPFIDNPLFFAVHGPMNGSNYIFQSLANADYGSVITASIRYVIFLIVGETHEARIYYILILIFCFAIWRKLTALFSKSKLINILVPLMAILNPLFINRLLLGHHKLLLGFTIMSLACALAIKIMQESKITVAESGKKCLQVILIALIATTFANHVLPLFVLFALISGGVMYKKIPFYLKSLKSAAFSKSNLGIVIAIIILTIITALGLIKSAQEIQSFSSSDLQLFAPVSDSYYGLFINLVNFFGLWVERGGLITSKSISGAFWILPGLIIQVVILMAWVKLFNKEKKIALILGIVFSISLILSFGLNTTLDSASLPFKFLYDIGFIKGIREATKFLHLSFLPFMICLIYGLDLVFKQAQTWIKYAITLVVVVLLLANLYTASSLGHGQISACQYPKIALNLQSSIDDKDKVLVMPEASGDYYQFCDGLIHNVTMLFKTTPETLAFDTTDNVYFDATQLQNLKEKYQVQHLFILKPKFQTVEIDAKFCKIFAEDEQAISCTF